MEPVVLLIVLLVGLLHCMCYIAMDIGRARGRNEWRLTIYLVSALLVLFGIGTVGVVVVAYAIPY